MEPLTRTEQLLDGQDLEPITRKEQFIKRIYDKTQAVPEPITREEYFLNKAGEGGGDVTIEQLNVSQNGTYSEQGKAYSPVIVSVPAPVLKTKTVTENGEYNASADNADGFSKVTVSVAPPENSYVLTTKKDDVVDISDAAEFSVRNVKADVTASDEVFVYVGAGSEVINDKEPYNFRASKSGDRVYEDAIVGGSVAWNQLMNKDNYPASSGIFTNNGDGSITADGTATETTAMVLEDIRNRVIARHKYLVVSGLDSVGSATTFELMILRFINETNNLNLYRNTTIAVCGNSNSLTSIMVQAVVRDGTTVSNLVFKPQIFDLTLALGSTIADYAYSLEQATVGSGIAWLKSQGFFTKDYYAYNAGGIQSVKTSAFKTTGFNQWDEVTELGSLNTSTGAETSSSDRLRTKNYISILPNTTYYPNVVYANRLTICYYDANKDFISSAVAYNINTFTTPTNARYMRFYIYPDYGTTYKNDICINIHWDGERDGEYEAYSEHVYNLDSDLELRGVPKLDSANKLYYDGDTYESDGTVTRKYGIVDLGTLEYNYFSAQIKFRTNAPITGIKPASSNSTITGVNCLISKFYSILAYNSTTETNMSFGIDTNGYLAIHNEGYTDATAFKTAMSGVYLVYELATPTTESADPYTNPQLVDNWGTEEFVDTRDVPIPVGHESRYYDGEIYHTYLYDSNGDKVTVTGTADIITGEVTGGNHCDKFTIIPKSTDDNVLVETGEVEVSYLVPLEEL